MASLVGDIIFRSTAKGTEKHLLQTLGWYNEQYGDRTCPTIAKLAEQIDRTIQHTFTLIKHLETDGHLGIKRVKEPGKRPRNYYTVLRPWENSTTDNTAQMNINISAPIDIKKEKKEIHPTKIFINKCAVKTDLTAEDNQCEVDTGNAPPTPSEKPMVTRGETCQETPSIAAPILLPPRPDNDLAQLHLDAETEAALKAEAVALLKSEVATPDFIVLGTIHSYMYKLWEARQKACHEGVETSGITQGQEEGPAHSATQAA
jgi:hypothetical protein